MSDLLQQAINGITVLIPFDELYIAGDQANGIGFESEADLRAWCDCFGLDYEKITTGTTTNYKIFKP